MQWHSCSGGDGVTIPGGVQYGEVAWKDTVSGHGVVGMGLVLGILDTFSNLNHSMILMHRVANYDDDLI